MGLVINKLNLIYAPLYFKAEMLYRHSSKLLKPLAPQAVQ